MPIDQILVFLENKDLKLKLMNLLNWHVICIISLTNFFQGVLHVVY